MVMPNGGGAHMKRREFIKLASGIALAWPLAARAQQPDRMRRIGMLTTFSENDREALSWMTVFRQQLERAGWTEGRNIRFDVRWGTGDLDRLRRYAAELVSLGRMPCLPIARR